MSPADPEIARSKKIFRGTLLVGLWTLFSRILGMLRDMATAATLGMSVGGVMDSFVLAFRLPDMARKMFAEGTLSVSFIPVFVRVWHADRQKAWTLLTVMLFRVFWTLLLAVTLGECLCWVGFSFFPPESKVFLVSHLTALMLPYLILICMAAIVSATLQSMGHFAIPAMTPSILNIVWLAGIIFATPFFTGNPAQQCYVLTLCILLAGLVQLFISFPLLKSLGFTLRFAPREVQPEMSRIFTGFFPQLFGLMTMQLLVLTSTCLAWLFSGPIDGTIRWLGHGLAYPLRPGAASAIYYSERLYEFPQGLIGMAIATVIYPLLSSHAARKDSKKFGHDLSIGLRVQFAFSIPAGIGLMLMADRLAHLLFQRGAFTPQDSFRTADMIFWFGAGVWAFCLLPLLVRAFYVVGDIRTPFRIGLLGFLLHFLIALTLIWPMQESGLALSISLGAAIQAIVLLALFTRRHGFIEHRGIALCIVRCAAASILMAIAVALVMKALPGNDSLSDILHILLGGCVGMFVYFVSLRAFGGRELGILTRGYLRKIDRKPNKNTKIKRRTRKRKRR